MRQALLTLGQMVGAHARLRPQSLGARDLERSMTFLEWNRRSCRLANAFLGLGLVRGDRVAVLAYNCVEWAEIYVAAAKAGLIAVPINFRLSAAEVAFIVRGCAGRSGRRAGRAPRRDRGGAGRAGHPAGELHAFRRRGGARRVAGLRGHCWRGPATASRGSTSARTSPGRSATLPGTTGNPKGVIRDHRCNALLAFMTDGRARPAPRGRGAAGDADVPCQLDLLLRRLRLLRRGDVDLFARELRPGALPAGARGVGGDVQLAGADALHHDAGPARRVAPARPRAGVEADGLLGAGPRRHQARDHGDVPELRALRALRVERVRLGDHAQAARAIHPSRDGGAGVRRVGADQAAGRGRPRSAGRGAGRALFLQPLDLWRLLEQSGEDRRGVPRQLLHGRATWRSATATATSV